jgi:hypothetical protein
LLRQSSYQSFQVLHKHLQTDVVCEDGLPIARTRSGTVHVCRHVRCRGVQLREKETGLTSALIANDVTWDWLPFGQKVLKIFGLDHNKSLEKNDKPGRQRRGSQATP